jgi:hypothetical protein
MLKILPIPKPPGAEAVRFPAEKLCWLLGADGVYKQIINEFYAVRVKQNGIPQLAHIEETLTLGVAKLPLRLLKQAEAFFTEVYQKHGGEAVLVLLANPQTGAWQIEVPPQTTRGLRVSYDVGALPEPPTGFKCFGSIHSHAGAEAFHSDTDDADESAFDGLHITIGRLDRPVRSYSARWMIAGKSFPTDLAEAVAFDEAEDFPAEWLDRIRTVPEFVDPWPETDCWDSPVPEDYEAYLQDLQAEIEERSAEYEELQREGRRKCLNLCNASP